MMKYTTVRTAKRTVAAAALFAAATSFAGVKYWDNPDFKSFDVGDYVQDGLVVNYDGIRNAGPNAPHDSNALTWVNLGSWGSGYDMTRYSLVSSAWQEGGSTGAWSGNGFVSAGSSIFYPVDQPWTLPESYSIQTLTDATSSGQGGNIGYLMCPYYDNTASGGDSDMQDGGLWQKNDWARFSIGIRKTSYTYRTSLSSSMYLCANDDMRGRVGIKQDLYQYMTAMLDSKTNAVIFSGITAPWAEDSNARISSTSANSTPWQNGTSGRTKRTFGKGVSIMGHYPRTDELFKGTLNSLRLYNKVLTDDEVAWNRLVDEYRFFGRSTDIPVTNVVVATSVVGVDGDQPCGAYALDEDGFTFTAPVQRTVKGYRYLLNGYTIETWNGSTWVADGEGTHLGNSYKASASAYVRVTWQYVRPDGDEGRLVVYDVGDYVQDGLVVNYDGICNAGPNAAHNPNAATWVNCVNPGTYDQKRYSLVNSAWVENVSEGAWTDDGFVFDKKSVFLEPTSITIPSSYSMQVLLDAKTSDQGGIGYIMCGQNATKWGYASIALRSNADIANTFYFNAMYPASGKSRPAISGGTYTYGTAILDKTNAVLFAGTEAPWAAAATGGTTGHYMNSDYTPAESPMPSGFSLGGHHPRTDELLKGTLKFYRLYNRVLSDAEVAENRKVDNYRYFGIVPVTNVIVQSTYPYLEGNEANGPYEVEGSFTFTAPATITTTNGIEYACDGYIAEKRSGRVGWVVIEEGAENSYRYETSAGIVRLTWKWKAVSGLRSAADYDIVDYSPAGLRLHYDGLLNAGVCVARNDTATKWVNLGSDGSAMDLTLKRADSDKNQSDWGEKGYDFAGYAMFESSATMWTTNNFTVQAFVDVALENNLSNPGNYIAATDWSRLGLQAYGYGSAARLNALGQDYMDPRPRFTPENGRLQYVTAIQNDSAKTTTIFPGTSAPTNGTANTGFRQYTTCSNEYSVAFRLGGWGGGAGSGQCLTGTINNFRYYDRVLTEEELVRNRNVDAVRYFGELGVTNVFVRTKFAAGGEQAESGAYKVEGSWDFTATTVLDRNDAVVPVAGYYTETFVDGEWTGRKWHSGQKYSYVEGTDPACVRLTWGPMPDGTMLLVR